MPPVLASTSAAKVSTAAVPARGLPHSETSHFSCGPATRVSCAETGGVIAAARSQAAGTRRWLVRRGFTNRMVHQGGVAPRRNPPRCPVASASRAVSVPMGAQRRRSHGSNPDGSGGTSGCGTGRHRQHEGKPQGKPIREAVDRLIEQASRLRTGKVPREAAGLWIGPAVCGVRGEEGQREPVDLDGLFPRATSIPCTANSRGGVGGTDSVGASGVPSIRRSRGKRAGRPAGWSRARAPRACQKFRVWRGAGSRALHGRFDLQARRLSTVPVRPA